MSDSQGTQTATTSQGGITIPDIVQSKFPEIVKLILASRSMNDEERQYWVDILPVMKEDQVANLKGILEKEKQQLSDIDEQYKGQINAEEERRELQQIGEDRKKRIDKRAAEEKKLEQHEAEKEENILDQIENL